MAAVSLPGLAGRVGLDLFVALERRVVLELPLGLAPRVEGLGADLAASIVVTPLKLIRSA